MEVIKIGTELYPAMLRAYPGRDPLWDDRLVQLVTMEADHAEMDQLFPAGGTLTWSVVTEYVTRSGETETAEKDRSQWPVIGAIIDNRDGTCTVKLGQKTTAELQQDVTVARMEAEAAQTALETLRAQLETQ